MNLYTYSSAGTPSAITSYEFNAVSGGSELTIFTGEFIDVIVTGLGTDNIKYLQLGIKTGNTFDTVARGDHEHNGVYDVSGASYSALTEAKEYAENLVESANTRISALERGTTSDERLKDFYEDIDCNLDELKNIPKKYFSWKDDASKGRQIGTSAQELYKIYPEIVSIDNEGIYSVAYDKLSIVALAAVDKLYEENKELKEEHLGL